MFASINRPGWRVGADKRGWHMSLKVAPIAWLFCLLGSPALAQYTQCYKAAGQTFCNTTPNLLDEIPSDAERRERQQRQRAMEDQDNRTRIRQRVGYLISLGQCDEAKTLALRSAEFELAEQAMKFCTPK